MPNPDPPPEHEHDHVIDQLLNKSWGELEVLEVDGRLMFPEKIYRRKGDGTFDSKPVLLTVPREPDLRWARTESRRLAEEAGLDLDRDVKYVDNLETLCVLSRCMRDPKNPKDEFDPFPAQLEESWDRESLLQIYEKINRYSLVVDPRPEMITDEQMLAVVAAIVKERNILPLAVFGPVAQNTCIVTMADRLSISLESKS